MRYRRTISMVVFIILYGLTLAGIERFFPSDYKTWSYVTTAVFVAVYLFYEFYLEPRWLQKEIYNKVSNHLAAVRSGDAPVKPAHPEYEVRFDAEAIHFVYPKPGESRSVRWRDLEAVMIRTTDQGPVVADCFWILGTPEQAVVFPMHSTGDPEFLHRLGELPGFDHEQVVLAMGCTDNAEFMCWRKAVD